MMTKRWLRVVHESRRVVLCSLRLAGQDEQRQPRRESEHVR